MAFTSPSLVHPKNELNGGGIFGRRREGFSSQECFDGPFSPGTPYTPLVHADPSNMNPNDIQLLFKERGQLQPTV